jgi:hypothetical protein
LSEAIPITLVDASDGFRFAQPILRSPKPLRRYNPNGFGPECTQARDPGFDGKTLIHPGQMVERLRLKLRFRPGIRLACILR